MASWSGKLFQTPHFSSAPESFLERERECHVTLIFWAPYLRGVKPLAERKP